MLFTFFDADYYCVNLTTLEKAMADPGHAPANTNPPQPCPPDPPDPRQPTKLSYATVTRPSLTATSGSKTNVLRRMPSIHLPARQYGLKDGKPSVSFTAAEQQAGIDILKHSLVVKFSGGRPPIDVIRSAFLESWPLSGACSIGAWDARHILVVLESELDARIVLSHPLRKLEHSLFRVFRWSTSFDTKKEPTTTTSWVRLSNLPPQMYNQGYIEPIVNSFGRFLAVDNKTVSFTNPSFARVCIEIDISKTLPEEVWISTGPQTGFWLHLIYENRPLYCTKCSLHGHNLVSCRKVKQRLEEESKIREARDEFGLPSGKPTGAFAQSSLTQTQLQRADTTAQSDRLAKLPITEQASGPPAGDKQEWTFVQNRKQKKKGLKQQRNVSASQTEYKQKGNNAFSHQATSNGHYPAPSPASIVLSLSNEADNPPMVSVDQSTCKEMAHQIVNEFSNIKQSALPTRNVLDSSMSRQNSNSDQKTKSDRSMALVVFNENNEDGRQVVADCYEVKPTMPLAAIEPSCELEKDLLMHGSPLINGEKEDEEYEVNNDSGDENGNLLLGDHIGLVHEYSPIISILQRTRHRKNYLNEPQRVIRSSARSCPKKKDSIFFWP